jgi:hypothetical protein
VLTKSNEPVGDSTLKQPMKKSNIDFERPRPLGVWDVTAKIVLMGVNVSSQKIFPQAPAI